MIIKKCPSILFYFEPKVIVLKVGIFDAYRVIDKEPWPPWSQCPLWRLEHGVRHFLPFLHVSLEAPVCDVHTLSCPPLSIRLHHSHPTPFLCHQLQSGLLPLSINLSPPSVSSSLSVCLFHPLISSSLSESLPSRLLPSFFPPLYNFAPCVSIPLVLCHSLSVPHLFSTLR